MRTLRGEKGAYSIQGKELGGGGNGVVWPATGPHGPVAVKLLRKRGKAPGDGPPRFANEITALMQLTGTPGVLPLLDHGRMDDGSQWFAMPVATTVTDRLGETADTAEIIRACRGIAAALSNVHEKGFAHRDIKPSNLFWYEGSWCVGDFGLVEFADAPELTVDGKKLGPAHYIAPEMLNAAGRSDGKRADIYSLGKTLWVLLSGQKYPLPGVHDPTYDAVSLQFFRSDPRMAVADELVRRMTLLRPEARPTASKVREELDVLLKEPKMTDAQDPTVAFQRIRAALAPHQDEAAAKKQYLETAHRMLDPLRHVVNTLVDQVAAQTGLSSSKWFDMPDFWKYRESMTSQVRCLEHYYHGRSFEAGSERSTWVLSFGYGASVLSDQSMLIHAGYDLEPKVRGTSTRYMGMPQMWEAEASAQVGLPSGAEAVQGLGNGLREHLTPTLEAFARRLDELRSQ
jgi:serine/threonine protein kinase